MNEEEVKQRVSEMIERFQSMIKADDKAMIVISTLLTMITSYCVQTDDPIDLCIDITKDMLKAVSRAVKILKEEENA